MIEREEWPRPRPGNTPTKVAIVGFAASRASAPYGEPGWELWGLNDPIDAPGVPPRHAFTRWFQLHPPRYLRTHYPRGLVDLERHWDMRTGIRLYMDQHYQDYPDSEPYPYDEVVAMAPHAWYHASSFDWMVALAIREAFEEIAIYGCDLRAFPVMNGEPLSALAALSYWCGLAEGRGSKVTIAGGGHLFRTLHLAVHDSELQYGWEREPGLDLSLVDAKWSDLR